jgi:hypothetical protein
MLDTKVNNFYLSLLRVTLRGLVIQNYELERKAQKSKRIREKSTCNMHYSIIEENFTSNKTQGKLIDPKMQTYIILLSSLVPSFYLYYYIKQLRIGGSIFYHGIFLLYSFYPSIRRIISIFC